MEEYSGRYSPMNSLWEGHTMDVCIGLHSRACDQSHPFYITFIIRLSIKLIKSLYTREED